VGLSDKIVKEAKGPWQEDTKIETGWHVLRWEVTWQQWCGKTSETFTVWQICIEYRRQFSWWTGESQRIIIVTDYRLAHGLHWQRGRMANSYSVREHGSGQKN
jgi:hypothetical protein